MLEVLNKARGAAMWSYQPKPTRTRRKDQGFTLIELIITITIVGILAALAMPSFNDFILNQRAKNASFDLMSALTLTRSEAIKRNASVTMTQVSGGWQNGWTVDVGGTVLRSWGAYPGLSLASSPIVTSVTYSREGRAVATTTFIVNDNISNTQVKTRCIKIDLGGRPNSSISRADGSCS